MGSGIAGGSILGGCFRAGRRGGNGGRCAERGVVVVAAAGVVTAVVGDGSAASMHKCVEARCWDSTPRHAYRAM